MKFKVRDKVRVTGDTGENNHEFDKDTIGLIDQVSKNSRSMVVYLVTSPEGLGWWVCEQDLELVEKPEISGEAPKDPLELVVGDIKARIAQEEDLGRLAKFAEILNNLLC